MIQIVRTLLLKTIVDLTPILFIISMRGKTRFLTLMEAVTTKAWLELGTPRFSRRSKGLNRKSGNDNPSLPFFGQIKNFL